MTTEDRIKLLEDFVAQLSKSDRYTFQKKLQLFDGKNIQVGKAHGTIIATETTQKLGFYGKTPVAQQPNIPVPSGGATIDAEARVAIANLISTLRNIGINA